MEGILEQILSELIEIKKLLSDNQIPNDVISKGQLNNDTMKSKEAAEYLGIAEYRLRMLSKQGMLKHFKAGNKYLYKRRALDQWLQEVQESSIEKNEYKKVPNRIREVKE